MKFASSHVRTFQQQSCRLGLVNLTYNMISFFFFIYFSLEIFLLLESRLEV